MPSTRGSTVPLALLLAASTILGCTAEADPPTLPPVARETAPEGVDDDAVSTGGTADDARPPSTSLRTTEPDLVLDDARYVGVDEGGTVYLAEFTTRRVLRLSADLELLGEWTADAVDREITGMAAGPDGRLHVLQGFDLTTYDGETGEVLARAGGGAPGVVVRTDVTVSPEGRVAVVVEDGPTTDLVLLDDDLAEVRRVPLGAVAAEDLFGAEVALAPGDRPVLHLDRVEEGGPAQPLVLLLDADGEVEQELPLAVERALGDVAVHDSGRIVLSARPSAVIDVTGTELARLDVPGPASGVAFGPDGTSVYVSSREDLHRYDDVPAPR